MLLEVPVKYRHLEAVFMAVLPRLMENLRRLCSEAQVTFTSCSILLGQAVYLPVADPA